jgi:hypothetical protein
MLSMADDHERQRRARNRALFAVLLGLVVLFYIMALVKMGAF